MPDAVSVPRGRVRAGRRRPAGPRRNGPVPSGAWPCSVHRVRFIGRPVRERSATACARLVRSCSSQDESG